MMKLKRFSLLAFTFCFALNGMVAQNRRNLTNQDGMGGMGDNNTFGQQGMGSSVGKDSTAVERTIPKDVKMWHLDSKLGTILPIETDTALHRFQNLHFTEGMSGEYNFLGNMGSPRQSRLFFSRPIGEQFIFAQLMDFFLTPTNRFNFTNTKSPYSNVSYYRAGDKIDGEERIKGYFAVNAGKHTGMGFNMDLLYGRGMYDSQSTSLFDASLYGYHHGERYGMHLLLNSDKLKWAENGGITDDRYITNPEAMAEGKKQYSPSDMPVLFQRTWNETRMKGGFLEQHYSLGYYKAHTDSLKDTVVIRHEFVEVSRLLHTLKVEGNRRRFITYTNPKDYYAYDYLRYDSTDVTHHFSVKNTVGLSLVEGFNKWVPAGATAYLTHEYRTFTLPDTLVGSNTEYTKTYKEQELTLGGNLRRTLGRTLHFDVTAETVLAGADLGGFSLEGKGDLNFNLWKDTVRLAFNGYMKNSNPSFYYRHYHSQHYWWDKDLDKEFRTRVEGSLIIDRWRTKLSAGVENIKNYTYLANTSVPKVNGNATTYLNDIDAKQYAQNIQVASATLNQDFVLGILHWDNELTYQLCSDPDILPLPALNVYSNLYLKFSYARVLKIELGGDVRYFTNYYAPDYSPAMGQYYLQNPATRIKIGDYPFINVYANFHLKQIRFYVMFYHVTQNTFNTARSFTVPHYPVNPRLFKLGLSWNLWD